MIDLKKLRKSKGLTLDDILKRRIEMKEIEVRTTVLVRAEVDAFRTGLNSGPRLRVKIGDQSVWVKAEDIQMKPELHLPRGSYKWDGIIDALVSPDDLCTGDPEDGVTEKKDDEG